METYQINILNPKAVKLLQDLVDLELITIKKSGKDNFQDIINRIREKADADPISLEEITKEVEAVRSKRYEAKKG